MTEFKPQDIAFEHPTTEQAKAQCGIYASMTTPSKIEASTLVEGETKATRPWKPIATPPAVGLRVEVAHSDDRYGLYETRGKIFGPITGEFTGADWECSEGFIVANGRLFVWTPTHWREARP